MMLSPTIYMRIRVSEMMETRELAVLDLPKDQDSMAIQSCDPHPMDKLKIRHDHLAH